MSKALVVTSVASMVDQFLIPSIVLLQDMGYTVEVACNFEKGSSCTEEKIQILKEKLIALEVKYYQVDFSRSIFNVSKHIRAYKQIKRMALNGEYSLVHCHSPIGGIITRLACRKLRKKGTKVFYTAHGFHFHKNSSTKSWLIYYPIEKMCSRWTDVLFTINKEDYALAQKKMKAKKVVYVPGVGIDVKKYTSTVINKTAKRREIGIPEDAFLLLSVGEVNENKNHQVIIKALAKLHNPIIHYVIVGKGANKDYLLKLSKKLGVRNQVHLLGFRTDINELNAISDVFCFPSYREGLGLAAIEAMACGLPILTSNIHGINDYSIHGITGYKYAPNDIDGFADGIQKLISNTLNFSVVREKNMSIAKTYDVSNINKIMIEEYKIRLHFIGLDNEQIR